LRRTLDLTDAPLDGGDVLGRQFGGEQSCRFFAPADRGRIVGVAARAPVPMKSAMGGAGQNGTFISPFRRGLPAGIVAGLADLVRAIRHKPISESQIVQLDHHQSEQKM
jgi:hypothetical protein